MRIFLCFIFFAWSGSIKLLAQKSPVSGNKEYKVNRNGLRYSILADSGGVNGEDGGWIVFHFIMKNDEDSILRNTFYEGKPIGIPISKASFKGGLEEGFLLLSKGDSAFFLVNADSIFEKTFHAPLPEEISKGSDVQFIIKVVNTYTPLEVEEEMAKGREQEEKNKAAEKLQQAADSTAIVKYLKQNKIKAKRTVNGVYVVMRKSLKGNKLVSGDTVSTHYTGKLLNGTRFDSSYDRGQPFTLVLGIGQVIKGWDEGLMSLKKGEEATLYIPSGMAYGPRGAGAGIPPNAILVFDIEIQK
jgi:FKBP-type peptidyl-prolyl cis-trans isomerase FkpA